MLGVEQQQHDAVRALGAQGRRSTAPVATRRPSNRKTALRAGDGGRERHEDEHGPRRAFVHLLEQDVEGQGQEDEERPVQQVGDNAQADKSGVRDNVPGRGRGVAGNVHLGFDEPFGKAAEDPDEQVQDAGDSREALR